MLLLLACGTPLAPVSDSTDGGASPGDTAVQVTDDETFLYAESGQVPTFALEIDGDALSSLAADPEEDVHATFTFAGESQEVGLHLKGAASFQDMSGKPSFKIDFHQWDPEGRFHGIKRLTLNNQVQDAAMSAEHTAYRLFADLGLVTPRHGYAWVTVNGEPYGLYGLPETPDEQFVDRWFEDDDEGSLYEGGYGADMVPELLSNFEQKEGDVTDRADLAALTSDIAASTPDDFLDVLGAHFDVVPLLDLWAGELVAGDADGYTSVANNFLIYHAPLAGRWTMIPWGPDQTFLSEQDVHYDYRGELASRCAASPDCAALLDERIAHAAEVMESADLHGYITAQTDRIEEECRTDPRSPWGDYGCRDAQAAMRAYVAARPGVVREFLR